MSLSTRFKLGWVAVLALAASACSVSGARPVEGPLAAPVRCAGGSIESAADAELYRGCAAVSGNLRVSAPELEDLSALSRLRVVTGTLEISGNSRLDDLSGLEGLHSAGALLIRDNARLATLRGLDGLRQTDRLVLEGNGLYQTAGISRLSRVGDLVVADNPKLNSLSGFRALKHARSVEIRSNPRLCAQRLLPALERVERPLKLQDNRGLSQPEVRQLLGRIAGGAAQPEADARTALRAVSEL